MHSLRTLYDKVGTMLVVYRFAEARLKLLGYIVIIEDRYRTVVQFHNLLLFGSNQSQVAFYFFIYAAVVYVDTVIRWVE